MFEEKERLWEYTTCGGGVVVGGGCREQRVLGGMGGRVGWGLYSFPGWALSRSSFSSWDSVNRQWLRVTRKVPGRAGQHRRRPPCMKIVAPVKALFWLLLQAHKQTALLIGPITHLVGQYNRFSFSTTVIKTCDLVYVHRLLHSQTHPC